MTQAQSAKAQSAKVREWTERFQRFQRTTATLTQFCRDEGVSMPSFYQWRKRLAAHHDLGSASKSGRSMSSAIQTVVQPLDVKINSNTVRVTIESQGVVIHCHCDSLQAIDTVLAWVTRQRDSGFQQILVGH